MKGLIDLVRQQLADELPLDVLLVIGCGRVGDLSGTESLAKRLILIDADSAIVQANLSVIGSKTHVESQQAVLSVKAGDVVFRKYNFPKFNSITESGALPGNTPNLRLVEEVALRGQTLAMLLDGLSISVSSQKVGLLMDIGTTAAQVLQSLQNDLLNGIRFLGVHLPLETSKIWEKSLLDSAERQSMVYKTRGQAVLQQGVNWLFERFVASPVGDLPRRPIREESVQRTGRPVPSKPALVIKTPVDDLQSSSRKKQELDSALKAALGDIDGLSSTSAPSGNESQVTGEGGRKPVFAQPELEHIKGQNALLIRQLEQSQTVRYELEARLKHFLNETEHGTNRLKLKAAEERIHELESKAQEMSLLREENKSLRALLEELQERQRLFNEEVVKGEAQLELIKDLLFREPKH